MRRLRTSERAKVRASLSLRAKLKLSLRAREMLVTGWAEPSAMRIFATPLSTEGIAAMLQRGGLAVYPPAGVSFIAPQPDRSKIKAVG